MRCEPVFVSEFPGNLEERDDGDQSYTYIHVYIYVNNVYCTCMRIDMAKCCDLASCSKVDPEQDYRLSV